MSDAFYEEMADVSAELLEEFDQGTLRLARLPVTIADSGRPWDVSLGDPAWTALNGVAKPVSQKYVSDRIQQSDTEVTFAPVPGLSPEPNPNDRIEVRGRLHRTVSVKRIPESGPVVVWKFFVRF